MSAQAFDPNTQTKPRYVFVSHRSACEALRANGADFPLWPEEPRLLPTRGDCVVGQRDLARVSRVEGFNQLGIVSKPVDILVPNSQFRHKGKQALTHPWSNLLPTNSMLRMRNHVLVSSPEFVLLQLANVHVRILPSVNRAVDHWKDECEVWRLLGINEQPPFEDFRAWEKIASCIRVARVSMEFAGTYRLPVHLGERAAYKQPQLTKVEDVRSFMREIPRTNTYKHSAAFESLEACLPWVVEHSRSPMETSLTLMLSLPVECGGYGLPQPQLNVTPERFGEHEVEADLLWEDAKLVVEYDSEEFHASKGRDKIDADIIRANKMRAAGYTVLEVTPGIAMDARRMDTLARQIAKLLCVSIEEKDCAVEDHVIRFRRQMLHRLLFFAE